MGRLSDYDAWLASRLAAVNEADRRLSALQAKFETFFAEMSKVRESELQQLGALVSAGRDRLPAWLAAALDAAQRAVEKDLDAQLARLEEERAGLERQAEEVRAGSMKDEEAVHRRNQDLDLREEALKAKNAQLLERIDGYNARIRELGTGFGFAKNLFAMRSLQREREALDEAQALVAAQIEEVRSRWAEREAAFAEAEEAARRKWVELRTKESAVQAKLEHLREARPALVFRSVLERVLFERQPPQVLPTAEDPKCPRCESANPQANHFCQICAARISPDRPDLEGSLEEIAEANDHYARFAQGMKTCQEVIGLVRGLKSGIVSFRLSVTTMIANESKYPLPKLKIEVPAAAEAFGKKLDRLRDFVQPELSLHPKVFGERIGALAAELSPDAIKAWFETLGNELSVQAKRQWG